MNSELCAERRDLDHPWEIWTNDEGWEYRVLQKQSSNRGEVWYCAVASPATYGSYEYGEVAPEEVKSGTAQTFIDEELPQVFPHAERPQRYGTTESIPGDEDAGKMLDMDEFAHLYLFCGGAGMAYKVVDREHVLHFFFSVSPEDLMNSAHSDWYVALDDSTPGFPQINLTLGEEEDALVVPFIFGVQGPQELDEAILMVEQEGLPVHILLAYKGKLGFAYRRVIGVDVGTRVKLAKIIRQLAGTEREEEQDGAIQ